MTTFNRGDKVEIPSEGSKVWIVAATLEGGKVRLYPARRTRYDASARAIEPGRLQVHDENAAKAAKEAEKAAKLAVAKACQICERRIFAETGMIAHHGYQRPGSGWQTASCFGARQMPFEVSCDALVTWIDDVLKPQQERNVAYRARLDVAGVEVPGPSVAWLDGEGKQRFDADGRKLRHNPLIGPGHADYPWHLRNTISRTESEIRNLTEEIERQGERLKNWKPA